MIDITSGKPGSLKKHSPALPVIPALPLPVTFTGNDLKPLPVTCFTGITGNIFILPVNRDLSLRCINADRNPYRFI